jgi:hypothetical protein
MATEGKLQCGHLIRIFGRHLALLRHGYGTVKSVAISPVQVDGRYQCNAKNGAGGERMPHVRQRNECEMRFSGGFSVMPVARKQLRPVSVRGFDQCASHSSRHDLRKRKVKQAAALSG